MNVVLLVLVVGSCVAALVAGSIGTLSGAMVQSAKSAVELALGLVGSMSLWLGLMAIVERAGLMEKIARAMMPVMRRLFPSVPADHPAMAAMILNFSANFLGMDNAATAFGIKAMRSLNGLNGAPGVATNAMVLFLAINTAGIQAVPINVIGARGALNPATAGAIVLPTFIVSLLGICVAVVWAKLFQRLSSPDPAPASHLVDEVRLAVEPTQAPSWQRLAAIGASCVLLAALAYRLQLEISANGWSHTVRTASGWTLALLSAAILLYGWSRGVKLYEVAISGAKEGFDIAVRIMPYLVVVLVGVGMFRASGLLDALVSVLAPVTSWVGMPAEVLPQALIRPLSGSAAMALLVDTLKTSGPDSLIGFVSSVIYGSSETTFYVLAVYFGAISVRNLRHALVTCLAADVSGVLLSVWIARWFY